MGITFVQQTTVNSATAITNTRTLTGVAAGNILQVDIGNRTATTLPTDISDSVNGAWPLVDGTDGHGRGHASVGISQGCYFFRNSGAGNPLITVTFAGSVTSLMKATELHPDNAASVTLEDFAHADNVAATTHSTGTVDTAGTGILLTGNTAGSSLTETVAAGYTAKSDDGLRMWTQYQVRASGVSGHDGAHTTSAGGDSVGVIIALTDAAGASAPVIVDVDEDNTIGVEQANVSVDITNGDNAVIEVRQGDHVFEITPDSASATEVIFDMPITSTSGGAGPHKGAATVAVINDDAQEDTQAITITEAADELETLMASPSVDPEATIIVTDPPFVAGDYIRIRVLDAGFDQTDFTLNDDGTYDFTEGLSLEDVEGQHWVEATGIWSDWEPISEGAVEFESASGRTRDGRRRGMLRLIGGRG